MLGSQWSKAELERFYKAYHKHGKNWKKVARAVRSRTVKEVEALYNMNMTYLSLADGSGNSSAAGLVALMTDHYNLLEGNDGDGDVNRDIDRDGSNLGGRSISKSRKRRAGGEIGHSPFRGNAGSLDLSKRLSISRMLWRSIPIVVGKRASRFPVSSYARNGSEIENGRGANQPTINGAAPASVETSPKGEQPRQVLRGRIDVSGSRGRFSKSNKIEYLKCVVSDANDECLESSFGVGQVEDGYLNHPHGTRSSKELVIEEFNDDEILAANMLLSMTPEILAVSPIESSYLLLRRE